MNLMHHTAILWRGPGSVQIGGDRARHVRLDDLHASDQLWLASQTRPAHASDAPEASPDLLAALTEADLVDHPDCRPLLSVGVLGAVPATLLALRSLVDTLALRLRIDATSLVDGDWDRVFGGVYTGTPRSRAVRRELASLIPLPDLHAQDAPDVALVSADRALDPGIPFELMAADTPHLLITRGEHSYEIGPFVIPGSTPCFHCIEHARAEQDPYHLTHLRELAQWPLGHLPQLAHFAAALRIARLLRDFASGALTPHLCAEIATVDEDGTITVERAIGARECVCGIDGVAC